MTAAFIRFSPAKRRKVPLENRGLAQFTNPVTSFPFSRTTGTAQTPIVLQASAASFLKPITGHKVSTAVSVATLVLGFLIGRQSKRSRKERLVSNVDDVVPSSSSSATILDEKASSSESSFEGVTPVWLNFALTRMWGLFQKNSKRLVSDTMQPVLDETELPDFVKSIRVAKFIPGRQSPLIQSVRRLPSRSLAEVQYAMRGIFSSTSVTEFEVQVELGGKEFKFPVMMENLDVDAKFWVSYALAPYEPFLTGVRWGLLESPKVTFEMTIAKVLPITAVPLLRKLFFRIITEEVPKDFMLPNTQFIDLTPPHIKAARENPRAIMELDASTEEAMRQAYPEQWALFDSMDLDNNGSLSGVEIFAGLKDWGYTAQDAEESFKDLDFDNGGTVTFQEFVRGWPKLEASFVPSRYTGELIGLVRRAEGVPDSLLGGDPVAVLRVNGQEVRTKKDSQTSVDGKRGEPVWMQAFDFKCMDPSKEDLEIVIEDGSLFGRGRELARATLPLSEYATNRNQKLTIDLEPKGSVMLDLSYAEFV